MKNDIIDFISKNRKFLFWGSIAFIFILLIIGVMVIIWVIRLSPDAPIFMNIDGQPIKLELIKFIGWGMGGLIAILSVIGLLRRATALDKQNEMTEKGHVQERFKAATEHLGSKQVSVRIAAFYEFYRLAKIESEPNLREHIFDILGAHLRQTTKDKNYQKEEKDSGTLKSTTLTPEDEYYQQNKKASTAETKEIQPTEEMQNLLKILIKFGNKNNMTVDLEGANLQGADLRHANLQGAILYKAKLQNADLEEADMQKTDLKHANLQGIDLSKANLQGADLRHANLQKAILYKAKLQNANLEEADMQGANLSEANLQGADLLYVELQNADLEDADLQGANLRGAKINKSTTILPPNWEDVVKKDGNGKTEVLFVTD